MTINNVIMRWLERPMSLLNPGGARDSREAYQLRFLTGAIVLAVAVSLAAIAISLVNGSWRGATISGVYLLLILLQAIALRLGAAISVMSWTILATVGLVLVASAVVPHSNQSGQLYWFLLIPLAARSLAVDHHDAPGASRSWRIEFIAGFVALAAVVLVALFHMTQSVPPQHTNAVTFDVALDVALFFMSALGLLYVHDVSVRQTTEELRRLQKLLSICAWCRTIKHKDQWIPLEDYIAERQGAEITHSMCPSCFKNFNRKH
jgi:hypothetical protein